jgi:phage terminase large subunit-like protein
MGRVEDGVGTGMIPKDAIVDWKKKQHGASGAIEFVIVRHGGGGDVQAGLSYCGFKSYDQGREKFQADTLDLVWLDEEPDEKLYFEAFTRISTTDGMCTMTFTPLKGATRVVRRFIMDKIPGTHVTTMTIEDAEHFTPEQRKRREEQYPEHEREARLRGVPSLGSGAVYPVPDSAIAVKRFQVPDHWPQIGGIDFGHYDHPTGAIQLAWDVDSSPDEAFQKCYLFRAHRQRKATPALFVPNVLSWGRGWLPWAWPADGLQHDRGNSGLQVAQHYADQGLLMIGEHAQFIDKTVSVEAGITQILDAMLGGRFFVFDDLLDWFEEKRMYHRAEGKIVKIDEDLLCAMRYAWMMRRFASVPPRAKKPDRSSHKSWRTV